MQERGYWSVLARPRPWQFTHGKALNALVTHRPRWWYARIRVTPVNGQRRRTCWVYAKRVRRRHLGDVTVVLSTCRRNDGPKQTKILVTNRPDTVTARQMERSVAMAILAYLLLLRLQAKRMPADGPWSAFPRPRQLTWDVLQAPCERSAHQLARKWLQMGKAA